MNIVPDASNPPELWTTQAVDMHIEVSSSASKLDSMCRIKDNFTSRKLQFVKGKEGRSDVSCANRAHTYSTAFVRHDGTTFDISSTPSSLAKTTND